MVKHVLKKAQQTNTDTHLALLTLRNTPVTGMDYSPAQMLMGRVLRSTLPTSITILQPAVPKEVHSTLKNLQTRQQQYYNRGVKRLPELHPRSTVHMETPHSWRPVVVMAQRDEPRSYDIVTSSGQHYRRNRCRLRRRTHSIQMNSDTDSLSDEQVSTPDAGPADSVDIELSSMSQTAQTRCGRPVTTRA